MYPHAPYYGIAPPYFGNPVASFIRCGNILSWKRVQGASGKLQAFGFCEYEDPESTMRCVRILNGFNVGDKKLLVKVDPKTEDLLNEYRKKKEETGEKGTLGATAEEIDSSTLRDDESVKSALEAILKENSAVLDGSESPRKLDTYLEGPRHLTMEDMDLDDDRKDLINREIEIFRKRNEVKMKHFVASGHFLLRVDR
ncbi:RNA-binding protein 25 [Paragonimus westermani]|uniref:RNA-binding protein 25 n=1 Tax=Paragonimus westermani TaxID=34504 RepID=A0A5J4P1X4_9TREM|nr:RNA-binding protein 25 [Paragonimus westermani]